MGTVAGAPHLFSDEVKIVLRIRLTPILLLVLCSLVTTAAGASPFERLFAPKSELWPRWTKHAERSDRSIDHSAWNSFLQRYVVASDDGIHRVAYAAVSGEDRSRLDAYVAALAGLSISDYARAEQFAYWINLYNALTVKVVLDHYPVASIRDIDISPGLFANGPWDGVLVEVEGEGLTLNDIEHRILRPIWDDPRIHYAVNCASIGCPNLLTEAFTAGASERLLDSAARAYINHPRGVGVQADGITLSSIYNWFVTDFDADGGVLPHLQRYAATELAAQLQSQPRIIDYVYDWSLNDSGN